MARLPSRRWVDLSPPAEGAMRSGIAVSQPVNPDLDPRANPVVSQAVDPVPVDRRHPDAHAGIVSYRLRLSSDPRTSRRPSKHERESSRHVATTLLLARTCGRTALEGTFRHTFVCERGSQRRLDCRRADRPAPNRGSRSGHRPGAAGSVGSAEVGTCEPDGDPGAREHRLHRARGETALVGCGGADGSRSQDGLWDRVTCFAGSPRS